MANSSESQLRAKFHEIVQMALLPEHDDLIVAYRVEPLELMTTIQELLHQGYAIETYHNPVDDYISICLKGRYASCVNAGDWLYGNGKTFEAALESLLFKHYHLSNGQKWVKNAATKDDRLRW